MPENTNAIPNPIPEFDPHGMGNKLREITPTPGAPLSPAEPIRPVDPAPEVPDGDRDGLTPVL